MNVNQPPELPALFTTLGPTIQQVIFGMGPVLLIGALVFAGYTRLTAADNAKKVQQANFTIMWAVIGYGVVLTSFLLIRLIGSLLGYNVGSSIDVTL